MNKISVSQIEGFLTQKKDLRKNRGSSTHLIVAKASNTKGFIDRLRSGCTV